MISTVIHITNSVDKDLITRLFAKFASRYGKLWTTRLGEGGDWQACLEDWFEELSVFTNGQVRAAVNKALAIYKDYPPTQPQLVELCLKESGVPDEVSVRSMLIAKDFSHPVVKIIYDKIGSWKLANGTEKELNDKINAAYPQAVADFSLDPKLEWARLQDFKDIKVKTLTAPEKLPTTEERKGFKERLAEYQQKIEDSKNDCKGKTYREFDVKAINPNSASFNGQIYNDYKAYLLSIPDSQTMILPVAYIFDRMMFVAKREQPEYLKDAGYIPHEQRESYESPKASDKKPTPIYKTWVRD